MESVKSDCIPKKWNWRKVLISLVIIPLVGSCFISMFFCPDCLSEGHYYQFFVNTLFSYFYWVFIAFGSDVLVERLDLYFEWLKQPVLRAVLGVFGNLLYVLLVVFVMNYFFTIIILKANYIEVLLSGKLTSNMIYTTLIATFISLFFHARGFFLAWREAALQNEKLKNEGLNSKLESLKSQINPHFLFNSLNALTSLVYDDQEKAVDFIQRLSDVYRYVLKNKGNELVSLREELAFVNSFVDLNKVRFGDNLEVNYLGFDDIGNHMMVPPLVLQLLVENCIKHNEISKEKHLKIEVRLTEQQLMVSNNINEIKVEKRDSSGLGLSNIVSRYGYLTDQEVSIQNEAGKFEVIIPVLTVDNV